MNRTSPFVLQVAICLVAPALTLASDASDASTSTASVPGPTKRDIIHCEKATESFLASDYFTDKSVPARYFTPKFASLWIWACTPDQSGFPFYNYEPILETQDGEPRMHGFGPGAIEDDRIKVPVSYEGNEFFTKEFVFVKVDNRWLIEDIFTTKQGSGRRSEVAYLEENRAFRDKSRQ